MTRLFLWLLLLIAVQCLSGYSLAAAFLFLPILGRRILKRAWNLVWRTRWLLLSLLLILSWGIAGDPVWESNYSPTFEGIHDALFHLGRLLLVLVAVAAFLETMPLPDLLSATHSLLGPLRRLGLDPDRGVVRLMLALRYAETLPKPRDWRHLLDVPPIQACERIEVQHTPLRWADYCIAALGVMVTVSICFW